MIRTAGLLLTVQFGALLAGALMFVGRGGIQDPNPTAPSTVYLVIERSLIMTAAVLTALGLMALIATNRAGHSSLALLGAVGYAIAALILIVAESRGLVAGNSPYGAIVVYVVAAFVSQAVLGAALIQAMPFAWIGGAMIAWNIGWLVLLPLMSPRDIYFPVLHHVMPLVLGIGVWSSPSFTDT